jgi:hypothetical protein
MLRVEFIPQFYMGEDDVVLVALDRDGIEQLAGAMRQASKPSRSPIVLGVGQQNHVLMTEEGGGAIEIRDGDVIWRLSSECMEEIAFKLEAMKVSPGPCHHYVDITEPASTLILSRDEYPDSPLSFAP